MLDGYHHMFVQEQQARLLVNPAMKHDIIRAVSLDRRSGAYVSNGGDSVDLRPGDQIMFVAKLRGPVPTLHRFALLGRDTGETKGEFDAAEDQLVILAQATRVSKETGVGLRFLRRPGDVAQG